MPSFREKVTTYFRQLSFIAEPRESQRGGGVGRRRADCVDDDDDNNFIIKYLEGRMIRQFTPSPKVYSGQVPAEMPELNIAKYPSGANTIIAACTGPDEGLTGIKRSKLHLSASFADDIDFIDTITEADSYDARKSSLTNSKFSRGNSLKKPATGNVNGTTNSDQNANRANSMRSRKNSRTSLTNKELTLANKPANNKSEETTNGHSVCSDQNNKNLINSTLQSQSQSQSQSVGGGVEQKLSNATLGNNITERLLREAVSSQAVVSDNYKLDTIAGVADWNRENEYAYGISVSLYENNMLAKEPVGNPIADCYGLVVHGDAAAMAIADGVNWGDGARLAARSAIHGCLDYLDCAVFGITEECKARTTHEVFVSLLRSLWEGHGCILEVGGALSTLTIAVILPLASDMQTEHTDKFVVCACNVGDSLGYIYSKQHGVRELTQDSHDTTTMRDMRDALGALGPVNGNKPDLSNLTLSMTIIERGDIVFLTTDGVSDNFDPVVGKFAEAWTSDVKLQNCASNSKYGNVLAPKRQNKSTSSIGNANPAPPTQTRAAQQRSNAAPSRPKYIRSQTVIEPRRLPAGTGTHLKTATPPSIRAPNPPLSIPRSVNGLPLVTGVQRHALTLHRFEDLLSYGINGTFSPCVSARRLCLLLIDFVRMITSARRKTLEQRELFYKLSGSGRDGERREVELSRMQHRSARRRIVESTAFTSLPGKLDHATVLAFTVGGNSTNPESVPEGVLPSQQTKEFSETNF